MEFFRIRRDINFMKHAMVFNIISLAAFLLAVFFLATRGLHLGVEFTGGTVMELRYNDESRLAVAKDLAGQAVVIDDTAPAEAPLVMGWVHDTGEQMFVDGF